MSNTDLIVEFVVEGFYPKRGLFNTTDTNNREWLAWMTCDTLEQAERLVEGAVQTGGNPQSFTKLRVVKVIKQREILADNIMLSVTKR